jgi:GTPase SAR1 family protein
LKREEGTKLICQNCGLDIDDSFIEKMKKSVKDDIHCFVCKGLLIKYESDITIQDETCSIQLQKLPHPIAISIDHLYEDKRKNASALEKLFSIRDIFEVTVKYLAIFEIAFGLEHNTLTEIERKDILVKLARPSLGIWLGLFKLLSKKHFSIRVRDSYSYDHLFYNQTSNDGLSESKLLKKWNEFVTFRNSVIGHGARLKQSEYEKYFQEWDEEIHRWEELFKVLAMLPLVFWEDDHRIPFQGTILSVKEVGAKRGQLYIEYNDTPYYINPFIFIHLCDSCESIRLFFYDSNKNYGNSKANPRVNALEYDAGHKPALRQPISELEKVFGKENLAKAFRHVQYKIAEIEGKILSWSELISEHADISGRQFLLDQFNDFLKEKQFGIFLLTADPGVGKTAFSSYLIDNGISNTYFFYRRSAGIQSPNDFVKSIYHSLLLNYGIIEANPTNDPSEMRNKLENLLEDLSKNYLRTNEKCIIVVDGLDEGSITGDGKDAFDLLPKKLPKGFFLFVTSRNTIALNRILFESQIYHYTLKSDSLENINDLSVYIEKELSGERINDVNYIDMAKKYEGNFLLTKLVIEAIKVGEFDNNSIHEKLLKVNKIEDYYNYYWETVYQSGGEQYFNLIYQILGLLAVSQSPLSETQISEILEFKVGDLEKGIRFCRQFLHVIEEDDEIYYRIFHDTFREYIRKKIQGSSKNLHGSITKYYADVEPDDPASYGLRYKLFHLAHSGNLVDLIAWIKVCVSYDAKNLLIDSIEDLVDETPIMKLTECKMNKQIKSWLKEFQGVSVTTTKVNLLSFLLYILQTKLGPNGITLYFKYVLRNVPSPLALVTNKYETENRPFAKIHRLIDIGEQIIKFYGFFYLALLIDENPENELTIELQNDIIRPSFGTFINIIRKALPVLYEKNNNMYAEHLNTWFTKLDGKNMAAKEELVEAEALLRIRNKYMHGATPTDEQVMDDIVNVFEKVKLFIYSLTTFSRYHLFEVIAQRDDKALVRYFKGGKVDKFQEEWVPFKSSEDVVGNLYFALPDQRFVCFSPFMRTFYDHDDIQFLYWNDAKKRYKNMVTYLNFDTATMYDFSIEKINFNFSRYLKKPSDPFSEKVDLLVDTFYGRERELMQISSFVQENNMGFFIIFGNPGSGKTSLIAKASVFFKEDKNVHVIRYFFSFGDMTSNPRYFLDYMNKRLDQITNSHFGKCTSIKEKHHLLLERLSFISRELVDKKLVIFIDIDSQISIESLFNNLVTTAYSNIFFVYTSRNTIWGNEFYNMLPIDHRTSFNVDEFISANIRAMLYERFSKYSIEEHHIQKLVSISQGNPLYIKLLLENFSLSMSLDELLNYRPKTIGELYGLAIKKIRSANNGDLAINLLRKISEKNVVDRDSLLPDFNYKDDLFDSTLKTIDSLIEIHEQNGKKTYKLVNPSLKGFLQGM